MHLSPEDRLMKSFVIVCKLMGMVALDMVTYSTAIPELHPVAEFPPEFYSMLTHNLDILVNHLAYLIACFSITVALLICLSIILLWATFALDLFCLFNTNVVWGGDWNNDSAEQERGKSENEDS